MRTEYVKPDWKRFADVLALPASKECRSKTPGCKLSRAHSLLNDAEFYIREFLNETEPNSGQEMAGLTMIKYLADTLLREERKMRDTLLRNGTDCPDAERCRGL